MTFRCVQTDRPTLVVMYDVQTNRLALARSQGKRSSVRIYGDAANAYDLVRLAFKTLAPRLAKLSCSAAESDRRTKNPEIRTNDA